MEKKKLIWVILVVAVLVLGAVMVLGTFTKQQQCLVWKNVEKKFESGGYNVIITETPLSMVLPVDNETYSFVDVGQSYNFYCYKSIFQDWKCHTSYECGEMGWR